MPLCAVGRSLALIRSWLPLSHLLCKFSGDEARQHGLSDGVLGAPELVLSGRLVASHKELLIPVNELAVEYPGIEDGVDGMVDLGQQVPHE